MLNFRQLFFPLLPTTGKKEILAMLSESFYIILLRRKIRLGFGRKKTGNHFLISCLWLSLSGSLFFHKLHITFATFDWQLSLSMLHTASKICIFVNTCPGLAARQQSAPYSKRVKGMSAPSFSTRRWCNLISNPGNGGRLHGFCGIRSARAAMAFSTVFFFGIVKYKHHYFCDKFYLLLCRLSVEEELYKAVHHCLCLINLIKKIYWILKIILDNFSLLNSY